MKRPAFQWYPGDARRDVAFQSCSFEARALWREMLDLMHDGEPYGHLTAGGVPMNTATLARLVGCPVKKVTAWMTELDDRKVFSRNDVGVIFSRRMVKDEHIRNTRAEAGKKGGNPQLLDNGLLNQTDKQTPTPASATAFASAFAETTVVGDWASDPLTSLAVWCNTAITETFGEQPLPLRRDQCSGLLAFVEHVRPEVIRESIYAQVRGKKSGPPAHPNYFRAGIEKAWESELTRRAVSASGERPPAIRVAPLYSPRPTKQEVGRAELSAWAFPDKEPNGL